jgi:ABC-type sugar transport system substrate-binding protein
MKRIRFSVLAALMLMVSAGMIFARGGGQSDGRPKVALSLALASDYYIGTMVGESVRAAFEDAGAAVQVIDAGNSVTNQVNQIQNAITSGNNIIYIFPAGDGATPPVTGPPILTCSRWQGGRV